MPVNFEIDFVQPLLKDLRNGEFANVQEYAEGITKYYVRAISKGIPLGIAPTLPAPSLSGAPGPVGTGPADAFGKPTIEGSKVRFENTVEQFYTAREIILSKETIEAKRRALEGIIRKAEHKTKELQATIKRVADLKDKLKQVPQDIKNTIEGVKELYGEYVKRIINVREEAVAIDFEGKLDEIDVKAEFKKKFPDESAILDSLLTLDFKDVQGTINTIQSAGEYFNRINASTQRSVIGLTNADQQREYIRRKLTQSVTRILTLANSLLAPDSLGELIADATKKGEQFSEKSKRVLDKAAAASDRLGVVRYFVEPEIKKLEAFIDRKKKEIKDELKKRSAAIKESIDRKVREVARKQSKIKIPQLSDKAKGFKAKAEKAKRDKDKFQKIAKENIELAKSAAKLIQKSTGVLSAADSIKDEILTSVDQLKTDVDKLVEQGKRTLDSAKDIKKDKLEAQVNQYLSDYSADILKQTPIVKTITSAQLDFLDVKKLLQQTDKKYDTLLDKVNGLSEDIEVVISEFQALKNSVPLKDKKKPKKVKIKRIERKPNQTILSVIKTLEEVVYPKIQALISKIQEWVDAKIKEGKAKILKTKENIEITLINSLPIPTESEDAKTKKQAAEEKKQLIKEYKVKVEQTTKKTKAITLLGTNAATLGSNVASGDISHASNEAVLRKIADNKFEFFTVGVSPASIEYKKQETARKVFLSEVDTFREIDTYISVARNIAKDVKNFKELKDRTVEGAKDQKDSFIAQLKSDYEKVIQDTKKSASNFEEAGIIGVSPLMEKLFASMETIFSGDLKPSEMIKEFKKIIIISQSGFLDETLQAQPVIRTLQNLERKYLLQTKNTLAKLVGVIPQEEEEQEIEDKAGVGSNEDQPIVGPTGTRLKQAQDDIEARKKAAFEKVRGSKLYNTLLDMYNAINEGRGSVISIVIQKLVELLKRVEVFIKKQIGDVIASAKKQVKALIQKNKAQYEERLKAQLRRKDFIDQVATSIMYNVATQLFWAGASWQNSVGTSFQVFFIQPMKRLKVNGRTEGYAAAVRELARNLENQLSGVQGLCIPNPSLGIPPFPFRGYK